MQAATRIQERPISRPISEEPGVHYRCEIARSEFLRTVNLPSVVDIDKSEALFKDGVLEQKVVKLNEAKHRSVKLD